MRTLLNRFFGMPKDEGAPMGKERIGKEPAAHKNLRFHKHRNMFELDALEHCYPMSFVSNNDGISARLQLLSNDTLLSSVCKFRASVPSVNWLQVPIEQLKSCLSKVDLSVIKAYCDLYLSPQSPPKSKIAKYGVIAKCFRFRSVFLFGLTDVEFFKNYFAFLPYNMPTPEVSRRQLVEDILKEEFGYEISEQLLLPSSSERKNEKKKQTCCENHMSSIVNTRETWDAYICSWPQPIPRDIVFECINAYYEATQLKIPPTCCVCARQQPDIEIHHVSLSAGDWLPNYFSILSVDVCGLALKWTNA
ncbi:hypothetical protein BDM02DRAFT_3128872 [Thelephora ganbajun]|uniref:Uncharacterized protein n=1 Tax=Thelephora ganbajun TaxID=370292 RepID=A0ACB6ZH58_THEGA|nr:hypothetical protein BDM02DRAFT_3128872 [Thelephora ganbajun]